MTTPGTLHLKTAIVFSFFFFAEGATGAIAKSDGRAGMVFPGKHGWYIDGG